MWLSYHALLTSTADETKQRDALHSLPGTCLTVPGSLHGVLVTDYSRAKLKEKMLTIYQKKFIKACIKGPLSISHEYV